MVRPTAHRRAVEGGDRRQPLSPRDRMPSRRAWKSVQLEVEVSSSQRSCEGSQASQSYLRAALEPRSPAADVDHAERQLERGEERLLEREQPLVLGLRLGRVDVREHLDLVELVHPDDPAGVLAVAAGLAAEAGREAGVAQGSSSRTSPEWNAASGTSDVPTR
jgi:hypothetical protein